MVLTAQSGSSLNSQQSVVPQLVLLIRGMIIRGDLEPGRRVSEAEFAGEFSVSRQPVREAFIRLSNEGLLEIRPQRGTYIPKISLKLVREARFVREAIEADVVKLAAQVFDTKQVADLRAQLEQQARCGDAEIEAFISLDDKFHRTLADGVGQGHAWNVVEGLKLQLDRVRYLSLRQFPTDILLEQHNAIVTAIAERNPIEAENRMREHLNNVVSDLDAIVEDNHEKFQP